MILCGGYQCVLERQITRCYYMFNDSGDADQWCIRDMSNVFSPVNCEVMCLFTFTCIC